MPKRSRLSKGAGVYKLQRWWRGSPFKGGTGRWETIQTSKSPSEIKRSFKGWCSQLDASFRVKSPKNRVVAKKYSRLYKMLKGVK